MAMMDKNIIGTSLTILTILGTFIYTLGITSNKIESFEKDINVNAVRINKADDDINDMKVSVAKLETKIDEWGKRLETLIVEN